MEKFFERGLLEKTSPSPEKGARSLKLAKGWLKRAKDSSMLGYKDLAVIASSTSMLHAARALLLKDGVREKDEESAVEYLKKCYPELRSHVVSLDQYRRLALAVQRDPDLSIAGGDAKAAMRSAGELIKAIEKMLSP